MLGLKTATRPAWAEAAQENLDELLADHAHCELKAAQSALSIVARHGGAYPELVQPLLELAREEIEHFEQVHRRLDDRKASLPLPAPDEYVVALQKAAKKNPSRSPLLDRLILSAIIEARSCERFRLLAEKLEDPDLRAFYHELMASEARHYRLFLDLAATCFGRDAATKRREELGVPENDIVRESAGAPTVHG